MDAKKLIVILVTIGAAIVSLVMINNLINRGEKSQAPAVTVAYPVAPAHTDVPPPDRQAKPVAEESDPQSYSGPMLR